MTGHISINARKFGPVLVVVLCLPGECHSVCGNSSHERVDLGSCVLLMAPVALEVAVCDAMKGVARRIALLHTFTVPMSLR